MLLSQGCFAVCMLISLLFILFSMYYFHIPSALQHRNTYKADLLCSHLKKEIKSHFKNVASYVRVMFTFLGSDYSIYTVQFAFV